MNVEYFVLEIPADNPKGYCTLDELEGFENRGEVRRGISLIDNPPGQLSMCMYVEEPRNTVLPDYVENMDRLMIISLRLKIFFESQDVAFIEYYPLMITDHKGKIVDGEYFIAHLIDPIDCIDVGASGAEWVNQGLATQRLQDIEEFVLDTIRIPVERTVFFPRFYNNYPVICSDMAEAMKKEGFTNVEIVPLDECAC